MLRNIVMNRTLFLFIDESGNFDFSPKGTKHFVLSCVSTFHPVEERLKFLKLRYELLESGVNQEFFHATEDSQDVRDQVFSIIQLLPDDFEIHAVIAQKNRVNPALYLEKYKKKGRENQRPVGTKFYQLVCRTLLQYLFKRAEFEEAEKVVVVLGSIFTRKKQSLILKTLKKYLKEKFGKPFEIYFHSAKVDINCQIADYCGWAVAVKWERNEKRPYALVQEKVKSEYDVFLGGGTEYYQYNK